MHCPVTLNDITKQIPLSIIFHRKQNLALLSQLNNPESSNDTIEKAEEASTTKTTSTQGNVDGSAEPTIVQIISDTDGRTLRNRMHRYVIIYSEGVKDEKQAVCEDEKKRVEYLAKLLTEVSSNTISYIFLSESPFQFIPSFIASLFVSADRQFILKSLESLPYHFCSIFIGAQST